MSQLDTVWNKSTIRELEQNSIASFVSDMRKFLTGRVLDFGAGKEGTCRKPQPYRHLVDGSYHPFDIGDKPPEGKFSAILCTQVFQYLPDPLDQLRDFGNKLLDDGTLVLTYPTNWDEVEDSDYWRFTKCGFDKLLGMAGFRPIIHRRRAEVDLGGFKFPLGYGVVAVTGSGVNQYTSLNADESVELLTKKILAREPFYFTKYGDGAIECIFGVGSGKQTCDLEVYTPHLAVQLKAAWDSLVSAPNVYVGDWLSADFNGNYTSAYPEYYQKMLGTAKPVMLHFECVLLHRRSLSLAAFYRTLKHIDAKKVMIGPKEMQQAAIDLNCFKFIETPMVDLYNNLDSIERKLLADPFDIVLYGTGMAGNIPITNVWKKHPDRTYINLGSALDPVYRGKTRTAQLPLHEIRKLMNGILS